MFDLHYKYKKFFSNNQILPESSRTISDVYLHPVQIEIPEDPAPGRLSSILGVRQKKGEYFYPPLIVINHNLN